MCRGEDFCDLSGFHAKGSEVPLDPNYGRDTQESVGQRWQLGHQYAERCATIVRRMIEPQTLHGRPTRA